MKTSKGSTLADVISALFLLTLISLVVFSTISFQWKSVKYIQNFEKIDFILKSELINFVENKDLTSKVVDEFNLNYSKKFLRNEFGLNFYMVKLEIINVDQGLRREYEFLIKE